MRVGWLRHVCTLYKHLTRLTSSFCINTQNTLPWLHQMDYHYVSVLVAMTSPEYNNSKLAKITNQ